MNEATKTLHQLKKASKLVRLAFRQNGPKSYKRGQGALLNALLAGDGSTQRELVKVLGLDRGDLKDVVKKAERNGYVTIEDVDTKHTYAVRLTPKGRELAQKRASANDEVAADILDCLSDDEVAQLNVITEKIILSCKDKGVSGKKKGRKACHHGEGHHHGHGSGHAHDHRCGCEEEHHDHRCGCDGGHHDHHHGHGHGHGHGEGQGHRHGHTGSPHCR